MALALIVFDCDGVLLESMDIKAMAFRRIGELFSPEMADRLVMHHRMNGGISRFRKFAWLFEQLGRPCTEEDLNALNEHFVEAAYKEMERCPLVPGALETLEHWHGRRPLFVASGAPEEELRLILEKRGLAPYFSGIFGSPAPKSHILRAILNHEGVSPGDAIMIGDARVDMLAAESVGCRFYGRGEFFASTGYSWHEDLTRLNAYLESVAARD